ncbi:DUF2189 domain-containing protein [Roseomonas elaeocarpi]|uniref:DUF2189 domain-containing protein n=1 Tax=Roseomonas elaeocarpi TaxID=907779 RepID=A0ABV6JUQ6_9PROT
MVRTTTVTTLATDDLPMVRRIGAGDVGAALRAGWEDFLANPTPVIFLSVIYPVIAVVGALSGSGRDLLPLVWPLVSGFALVGPLAALGIYEMSRRREQGLEVSWLNAFDILRSPSLGSILALGVVLLAIFVAWIGAARWIYAQTLGEQAPASAAQFARQLFTTDEGWRLVVLGNLAGALFALVVLALTVVSFPLLLDRPVSMATAMRTSIRALATNPGPMLLWGAIVGFLLLLGSLPFFVGLAIVLPVLGHATWHLFRRLVE